MQCDDFETSSYFARHRDRPKMSNRKLKPTALLVGYSGYPELRVSMSHRLKSSPT
jgi:hypothetical protein